MRSRGVLIFMCTAMSLLAVQSSAMDGICIANILTYDSYKSEYTPGKLVKYAIRNNYVEGVDTLPVTQAHSPKINMSGSYIAYITGNPGTPLDRKLAIRAIDGKSPAREIPLQPGAVWLWWVNDGSFYYTVNVVVNGQFTGQDRIRKVTLSKVNNQLVVNDVLYAKLMCAVQGGFCNVDGTGTKFMARAESSPDTCPSCPRVYVNGAFSRLDGDTSKYLTLDFGGPGCGYALSPSGIYWTGWGGGHNVSQWFRWDRTAMTPSSAHFDTMSTSWIVSRDSDPESHLRYRVGTGAWRPWPIGFMGEDNIWAQNSEYWHLIEVRHGSYYGGVNAIAVSWNWKKAINISKIMPVDSVLRAHGSDPLEQFTGITFSHAQQLSADRPTLWCSNQEDVWPDLWHFVQNRTADSLAWAELLSLPVTGIGAPGSRDVRLTPQRAALAFSMTNSNGLRAVLPVDAAYAVKVSTMSGQTVHDLRAAGRDLALPRLKSGMYVVSVRQAGREYRALVANGNCPGVPGLSSR